MIKNYPKYLMEFIKHRLDGRLSPINEKETKGKGGYREGAGRPKGSKSAPATKQIRVPADIADWLKYPETITHLRMLMESYNRKRHKIKYTEGPIGEIKIVDDFLPKPKENDIVLTPQ